jgi:uncharacterized protein YijF (DUF1287 family)
MGSSARFWLAAMGFGLLCGCAADRVPDRAAAKLLVSAATLKPHEQALLENLQRQTKAVKVYDPAYVASGYPVPSKGVCTDVILRAYASVGFNLRKAVNSDVAKNRKRYPYAKPDPAIDPRRCRVLITWFKRHSHPVKMEQLRPGDVVFYDVKGKGVATHIAMVGNRRSSDGLPTIFHHCPGWPVMETQWMRQSRLMGCFRVPQARFASLAPNHTL